MQKVGTPTTMFGAFFNINPVLQNASKHHNFPSFCSTEGKTSRAFFIFQTLVTGQDFFKLLPSVCCLVPTDLLILCKLHPHWLRSHLENVYHGKWCCVTGNFQFTMVVFTLVNCHDETRKNKGDPSSIAIWLKKIGGYISSLSKPCFHICLFCRQFDVIFEGRGKERTVFFHLLYVSILEFYSIHCKPTG